ncbi:TATA-box-binding protein [Natranaeroarchaeum aerophilus]|uniref:Transcription factor n=1 Tax=Natranaeroarchaeum aerophilus TaxID=2917711 RepID=A0AAE3K3N1_9EURY|nr:transcription factor [Natranaeroarchaeum aerophilus]MCL9812608.1 transcription factor [Natranaeroarchaeum aerophilus]
MSRLTIASIVATGKIDREFDLATLANDIDCYSYDYEEGRSGLHVQFYEEGPTATIFRSGSCNIRGASSEKALYENKSMLEDAISNLGIEGTISRFQITNIVFTADLNKSIDLNELAVKLGLENVEYEPEQFPGLVYRLDQGVILIFASGKLVLTGFTNRKDAKQALNTLSNKLTDV